MSVLDSSDCIHSRRGSKKKIIVIIVTTIGIFLSKKRNVDVLVVGLLETAVSMRIAETSFGSFSGGMVKARR